MGGAQAPVVLLQGRGGSTFCITHAYTSVPSPLAPTIYLDYGKLAFRDEQGYAATDEEKRLALDLYSAHFFLHHVIDTFRELTADDLTDEKKAALVQEAFERFDRFSDSIKNKTHVAYEERILKQEKGSPYEKRVAALEGVYSHLLGKAGLKKISFNHE